MPTSPHELRLLADQLEIIQRLEQKAADAKEAYRLDPGNPALKAAHRAASQELAQANQQVSLSSITVVTNEPGSVTIIPTPVQSGTTV